MYASHDGITKVKVRSDYVSDPGLRTGENSNQISYNEIQFNDEFGVLIKETGFNSSGEIVDQLSYYYEFDQDSSLHVAGERYSTKVYLESRDVSYLSVTDYFYNNFQMETY